MGIKDQLFKWFSAKDAKGETMKVGYVLEGNPKTEEDMKKLFTAFKLDSYFEQIKPLFRSQINLNLNPQEETEFKSAQSKIGGKPDLKSDQSWPENNNGEPLSFIGQLNMEEVALYDSSGLLPKKGLLSFFYCAEQEAWGYDPEDKHRFKVLFAEDLIGLKRTDFPPNLESIYNPNKIDFDAVMSVPTWEYELLDGVIREEDMDNYMSVSEGCDNQILGYANIIQNPMELECQFASNGLYCGDASGYEDPRAKELESGKNDWILLLQIDSEEEKTGMMWGDSGRIYFWIRKQDLANQNFDAVWCILQCY